MYQPPINSFFNTRKRCASEYLCAPTSKKLLLADDGDALKLAALNEEKAQKPIETLEKAENAEKTKTNLTVKRQVAVASRRRRILPDVRASVTGEGVSVKEKAFQSNNSRENAETPKKESEDLSIKEIQEKVMKSRKLPALKAQLKKLQELEKRRQELLQKNKTPVKEQKEQEGGQSLKKFDKLDLEVLSPTKLFKSPKMKTPTPLKPDTDLMSPRKEPPKTARKMLFSPLKDESPAYEKFASLVESGRPGIQLPFKYRQLVEMFKCCDAVCAMFHNRKETITFKKLKPAVQQMCRKTFTPQHLAQMKTVFPESYNFQQTKTRNYGSTSKQDYYQLIIQPGLEHLSPQALTDRQKIFQNSVEMMVRRRHDKFLKSLTPPMIIPMDKITRWHPEFDLEACPVIPEAEMPRAPNEEKFSSAKDVLSAAKNLFNCSTSLERTEKIMEARQETLCNQEAPKKPETVVSDLLKRVPAKLVEKIRARQAAKTLDAMTRRPSQDQEALTYSRLPDLAKHIRNIFLTEKKACLALELVLGKISNSFRQNLQLHQIEGLIGLLATEATEWLSVEEIRKVKYVKLTRGIDFWQIFRKLESLAAQKSL